MTKVAIGHDTLVQGSHGATVGEFWKWAYADLLVNTNRGVFAEFLVAHALGLTDAPRVEWDGVDLRYHDVPIEVKSSAYVQSWAKNPTPIIKFDIAAKKSWHSATNESDSEARRSARVYVFCVLTEDDEVRARRSILDTSYWDFYVVDTRRLDRDYLSQKSMRLSVVRRMATVTKFGELKSRVDEIIRQKQEQAE